MSAGDRWGVPIELGDRRVLHPGRWRWLRTVGWTFAFLFAFLLTIRPVTAVLSGVLPDNEVVVLVTRCVAVAVALGAYAGIARLGEDRWPRELSLRPALPGVLVGLAVGAAAVATVMGVMAVTGLYDLAWTGWTAAWDSVGQALQAGVVEELIARGLLFRLVWRAFGPRAAFVVSSVLFGASHLANPGATVFAALCIALEAGVMLGGFYALTGRLWVSFGAHIGWNFTTGFVFGAAVSGGDMGPALMSATPDGTAAELLTGGAFGPEASLPALVVCTAIGVATVLLARRAGRFRPRTAAGSPVEAPAAEPVPA